MLHLVDGIKTEPRLLPIQAVGGDGRRLVGPVLRLRIGVVSPAAGVGSTDVDVRIVRPGRELNFGFLQRPYPK